MIPFASQRGGGQDLATHLLNAHDNELTELVHLRGAVADDLHGAFKEWEVQAQSLTRCNKYLYSMSINPDPKHGELTRDQYMDYVRRAEETLGLSEQPRAVVFHTKQGREHCHVVWSRIDVDQKRAVHLAFDHDKLMRVTRSFARNHGIALPAGYDKSRQAGQISLYEQEQSRQTGMSKEDHIREVTEAWRLSDDPKAFVQALAERGYMLATGKRPYVLVDLYGNMNALPKLIDDKTVRTNDLRKFLEKDFPVESLPSVEEAKALVAAHRKLIEKSVDESRIAPQLASLKHAQQDRRLGLVAALAELKARHHSLRQEENSRQRQERDALRSGQRQKLKAVRQQRFENRPTGLAAFLGKITGIAFLQQVRARREDAKHMKLYLREKKELKVRQAGEQKAVDLRLKIQMQAAEAKLKSLEKVDKREIAALMREAKSQQRAQERGDSGIPKFRDAIAARPRKASPDNLSEQFDRAKHQEHVGLPDVLSAFSRAAREQDDQYSGEDGSQGVDRDGPSEPDSGRAADKDRDKGRGL